MHADCSVVKGSRGTNGIICSDQLAGTNAPSVFCAHIALCNPVTC